MSHLNPTLSKADFQDDKVIRRSDREGFKSQGEVEVVTLEGPFKLYKLTSDKARQGKYGVTPWWTPVDPYREDKEGAAGRYRQAYLNGIDMSSMVRYMSAVKVEWNDLKEYVEITIKAGCRVSCFWGEFAVMDLTDDWQTNQARYDTQRQTASGALGYSAAELPQKIGVLRAWQFFIPNLTDDYIEGGSTPQSRRCVDAHDMAALGLHLGVDLGNVKIWSDVVKYLGKFHADVEKARPYGYANRVLTDMGMALSCLIKLKLPPAQGLRYFYEQGRRYGSDVAAPLALKQVVESYVMTAAVILGGGVQLYSKL